ncbi:DUF2225 domain-containing protein [Streptomyces sp. STR69]|uniref:DUF2225 domain-containing protein n=1 Tax=Streptomyces sp. STR69 TaxID=1796942 RepID=UPI0021CA3BB3|nr:DUF2225 domain-containing protein [Streptomyces sp. STR69]
MTTIFPRDFNCPNCGTTFESYITGSTNNLGGVTTEFQQLARGSQPDRGFIHTCDNCGFTGSSDAFDGRVDKKVSQLISERITPLVRDERSSASRRFEYAAWIAKWRGQNSERIGSLYLRAAWAWGDEPEVENTDGQDYLRRQVIEYFERAIEENCAVGEHAQTIKYLIGEQYRRVGEPEAAARWYDRVIAEAGNAPEQRQLADLALQQKTDPKERLH